MPRKKPAHPRPLGPLSEAQRLKDQEVLLSQGRPLQYPREDPLLPAGALDALVLTLLIAPRRQFRFTTDRDDVVWAKVCIREGAYPRHYLLASFPPGTPFVVCLEGILRKVEAFEAGAVRPSPDKWTDA